MKPHQPILRQAVPTLLLLIVAANAMAQVPAAPLDTIVRRADHHFYNVWYDECDPFRTDLDLYQLEFFYVGPGFVPTDQFCIKQEYHISQPMAVKGLAAMVPIDLEEVYFEDYTNTVATERAPEYLILFQGGGYMDGFTPYHNPRSMWPLDSVRWDTATPKILKLPQNEHIDPQDSAHHLYCYLYEALFPSPVMVDSFFYVAGTFRSNKPEVEDPGWPVSDHFDYIPTAYTYVDDNDTARCPYCPMRQLLYQNSMTYTWVYDGAPGLQTSMFYTAGPFMLIVDYYTLTLASADPTLGGVEGGGRHPSQTTATFSAIPTSGHTFSHWSDGNTDNPRTVTMSHDISLTAYFN